MPAAIRKPCNNEDMVHDSSTNHHDYAAKMLDMPKVGTKPFVTVVMQVLHKKACSFWYSQWSKSYACSH